MTRLYADRPVCEGRTALSVYASYDDPTATAGTTSAEFTGIDVNDSERNSGGYLIPIPWSRAATARKSNMIDATPELPAVPGSIRPFTMSIPRPLVGRSTFGSF